MIQVPSTLSDANSVISEHVLVVAADADPAGGILLSKSGSALLYHVLCIIWSPANARMLRKNYCITPNVLNKFQLSIVEKVDTTRLAGRTILIYV